MNVTIIMQDNLIINLLGKDQEKSFRYLYEKYVVQLRYFAAKYIDDKMAVADIVQDAFVRLWEKKAQFQDENTIKAFLYRVVQNACIDLIRHHEAAQNYTKHVIAENEEDSFLDNILETEIFQALRTVFNELPPACKEVYLLSLNGKSHEQISQLLDISINTIKKHKNNANHYMRERLKHILSILLYI